MKGTRTAQLKLSIVNLILKYKVSLRKKKKKSFRKWESNKHKMEIKHAKACEAPLLWVL